MWPNPDFEQPTDPKPEWKGTFSYRAEPAPAGPSAERLPFWQKAAYETSNESREFDSCVAELRFPLDESGALGKADPAFSYAATDLLTSN